MTSACQVLQDEPDRFLDYVLADKKLRSQIVDEDSFREVLRRVLDSDPTLRNIVSVIDNAGEDLSICGRNIFQDGNVQDLVKRNVSNRRAKIRRKVKAQYPVYSRSQLTKEINRRLKISVSSAKYRAKQTKQITIQQSLQPVSVKGYSRAGKVITPYRKTKSRKLTQPERLLIQNNLNLPPAELVKKYYDSGLTFRSEASIKKHQIRMKKKLV